MGKKTGPKRLPSEIERQFAKTIMQETFSFAKDYEAIVDYPKNLKRLIASMDPTTQEMFKNTYFESRKPSLENKIKTVVRSYVNEFNVYKQDAFEFSGFTYEEFKSHIESMFDNNYNWNNWGEWHIDHIRPRKLFKTTKDKSIFGLANIRIISKKENLKKGGRCG